MKRLTDDLKRMLSAMALQDAADYPPMRDKMGGLGFSEPKRGAHLPGGGPRPSRRVALLSDGQDSNGPLHYALNACSNQQASLDLVLYGEAREQVEELRHQLQSSGIAYELILLGKQSMESLVDYLNSRHSLAYLVASADDALALELTQENSPHIDGRLHLPMVLVDRSPKVGINRLNSINAA